MDCSPPGSSVHGVFQARILEWVAIFSSRGSSQARDQTHVSWIAGSFFITKPPGKTSSLKYAALKMMTWYETCTSCSTTGKSPNPYPLLPLEMSVTRKSMTRHFRWCELYKHGDCIMWCSTVDFLNCPIPLLRIPPYPALQVWLPARVTICLHLPERESHPVVSNSLWPHGLYSPWNSPGQHTGVGSLSFFQGIFLSQGSNPGLLHCRQIFLSAEPEGKPKNTGMCSLSLLQGIFPTQELNQGLLHCRRILYQLSYEGSPGLLPILVPKVSCPRKLLSPRQPGQLVYLSCSHVLVHEPPLGPWLTQPMVLVLKLDRSPSLLLRFWMLNWEKFTRRLGVVLQHYYIKCSSLEQFHIKCMLKSPGTLKTCCWIGLGPWNWFNWFEMGPAYGRRRQWQPTPVLLPGKSHGWRGLVGCSPWGR